MKQKIKLISILGCSLFIVIYFLNYQSPEAMVYDLKFKLTHNRLLAGIFSKIIKKKPSVNIPGRVEVSYTIIPVKAREKVVVDYKGKRLVIWVSNSEKVDFDEKTLEFFYQLELLREKNKK